MKYTSTLLFVFLSFGIYAQENTISGEIINSQNGVNLEYVNIGIADRNVGTVSNVKGNFILKFSGKSRIG